MHHRTLAFILSTLALCVTAFAQSADYATISEQSRRAIIVTLALDEEQTEVLDDLIDGYLADADAIAARYARLIGEALEGDDEAYLRVARGRLLETDRDEELIDARDRLFDDLALVLDDEQSERVEDARTRARRAPVFAALAGDASGFTADPIRVAEELALYDILDGGELDRFREAMRVYDAVIDPKLDAFRRIARDLALALDEPDEATRDEAGDEYVESMIETIINLRSAHASGLRSIAPSLPSPLDEAWLDAALRLSHPRVFVDAWGETTIASLLGEDAFTQDERERLREIARQFAPRYESARVRIARAIERAEERVTVERAKRSSFITRNDPDVLEANARLRSLDERVRRAIVNALDPALRELVPPLPGG